MPWHLDVIHVVIGILKNKQNDILIAQRPMQLTSGGLWEFPGGKVEPGEDAFPALQREFLEEVGVCIVKAISWFDFTYHYPERSVLLDVWQVTEITGNPYGAEGQAIRWVKPHQLREFTFPAANKRVIDLLLSPP